MWKKLMFFSYLAASPVYEMKCPYRQFWNLRAMSVCDNLTKYHCILNGSSNTFVEKCLAPKKYRKGLQIVMNWNFDAIPCSNERFSPNNTWSNEGPFCPYKKSFCKEEGQVIVDHGNSSTDRLCRCDYTKGYNYIHKPRNPCRCFPVEEDCSCYKSTCFNQRGFIFTQDYVCASENIKLSFDEHKCGIIHLTRIQLNETTHSTTIVNLIENRNQIEDRNSKGRWWIPRILTAGFLIFTGTGICYFIVGTGIFCCFIVDIHKKKIYHQETKMPVIYHFQPTSEVKKIMKLFKKGEKTLLITGPPGAGKSQAVHYLCSKMKHDYSILAKLEGKDIDAFKHTLKNLIGHIGLEIKQEYRDDKEYISSLIEDLKKFLDHPSRTNCSYLLFVNNLKENPCLLKFLSVLKNVKKLRLIITSMDLNTNKMFDGSHIHLTGMGRDEYISFFRKNLMFGEDETMIIDEIVRLIGSTPLALKCARKYMTDGDTEMHKYLTLLKDVTTGQSIIDQEGDSFYDKGLLKSQIIPLKHIQNKLNEHQWEIMLCIPYLDHNYVWIDFLEACLFHHSKLTFNESIHDAKIIITECKRFSLCHICDRDSPIKCNAIKQNCLFFHKATTYVLKCMQGEIENKPEKTRERLLFLVKIFCFEMDINARVYDILERNLMLIGHARKVINAIEEYDISEFMHKVLLCYLNCVIGATLLFQGTDIKIAYQYLKTAKVLCLELVGIDSSFDMNHKENIKLMYDAFDKVNINENFIREFISHKRRSRNEKDFLQSETKMTKIGEYLSQSDYEALLEKTLAMPPELLGKQFLKDLMLHILYHNGRALNEINKLKESGSDKQACYHVFVAYDEFTSLMNTKEETSSFPSLHFLVSKRSGRQYMMWNKKDQHICTADINDEMSNVNKMLVDKAGTGTDGNMLENKRYYFDFGIVKILSTTNKHHICMCYRVQLKYLEKKFYISEEDDKEQIFKEGVSIYEKFRKEMQSIDENKLRNLLAMPSFYIQCGMFLYLSTKTKYLELSIKLYEKGIKIEEERGVFWTRFLREGFVGVIHCLMKLGRKAEARKKYKQIAKHLEGTGRNEFLKELKNEIDSWPVVHNNTK